MFDREGRLRAKVCAMDGRLDELVRLVNNNDFRADALASLVVAVQDEVKQLQCAHDGERTFVHGVRKRSFVIYREETCSKCGKTWQHTGETMDAAKFAYHTRMAEALKPTEGETE